MRSISFALKALMPPIRVFFHDDSGRQARIVGGHSGASRGDVAGVRGAPLAAAPQEPWWQMFAGEVVHCEKKHGYFVAVVDTPTSPSLDSSLSCLQTFEFDVFLGVGPQVFGGSTVGGKFKAHLLLRPSYRAAASRRTRVPHEQSAREQAPRRRGG